MVPRLRTLRSRAVVPQVPAIITLVACRQQPHHRQTRPQACGEPGEEMEGAMPRRVVDDANRDVAMTKKTDDRHHLGCCEQTQRR
jgi:hypothetical protein